MAIQAIHQRTLAQQLLKEHLALQAANIRATTPHLSASPNSVRTRLDLATLLISQKNPELLLRPLSPQFEKVKHALGVSLHRLSDFPPHALFGKSGLLASAPLNLSQLSAHELMRVEVAAITSTPSASPMAIKPEQFWLALGPVNTAFGRQTFSPTLRKTSWSSPFFRKPSRAIPYTRTSDNRNTRNTESPLLRLFQNLRAIVLRFLRNL